MEILRIIVFPICILDWQYIPLQLLCKQSGRPREPHYGHYDPIQAAAGVEGAGSDGQHRQTASGAAQPGITQPHGRASGSEKRLDQADLLGHIQGRRMADARKRRHLATRSAPRHFLGRFGQQQVRFCAAQA